MEEVGQRLRLPIKVICDKILHQRLQTLEDNQNVQVRMFPLKNTRKQTLDLILLDMNRCKVKQDQTYKLFVKVEFVSICQQIYLGTRRSQVLTTILTKYNLDQLFKKDSQQINISNPGSIQQINQMLKQCVIVSLKLPSGFYKQADCNYVLEGYKYNPKGKITEGWNYISNGKSTKSIVSSQNEKVRSQIRQNTNFSKNQLKKILQTIQFVNGLNNQQASKTNKISQELRALGQNFYHSQKYINNSNSLLPILNFQIQVLCSIVQGQNCRNKICNTPLQSTSTLTENVCLNFSLGLAYCQQQLRNRVELIFTGKRNEAEGGLLLTNMPTKVVNPHLFLKGQSKQKFSQYYIKGLYEYYHYGDNNFNDQGWGCAYRALQTLLSWFRLQQRLKLLSVPTVPQIQNLIDLIDCNADKKLSNSNSWIGATQVSWVVKRLSGCDCRILHIRDGKDIVQHAQMFRDHLQNVGSPIMYGGDQYAYSIVGINYSWKLGEISFLILDPHYSGSDKIQKILEKKGVCWRKPQEMFKKGVFYNFCLPIL